MMHNVPGVNSVLADHVMKFMTDEGMEAIPDDDEASGMWAIPLSGGTKLTEPVSVTLTASQWASVLALIRVGTAMSNRPAVGKLAHRAITQQVLHRSDTPPSEN